MREDAVIFLIYIIFTCIHMLSDRFIMLNENLMHLSDALFL